MSAKIEAHRPPPKHVIVVVEDDHTFYPIIEYAVSMTGTHELVQCKTLEECKNAFHKFGDRITHFITDTHLGDNDSGYDAVRALRCGAYGDSVKTIPAMLMSGGSYNTAKIKDIGEPVILIQKDNELPLNIEKFIKNEKISSLLPQITRDDNARELIALLTPNDSESTDRLAAHLTHHGYAQQWIKNLRSLVVASFADGAPSPELVEQLKGVASQLQPPHIDDDRLSNQLRIIISDLQSKVSLAKGPHYG